MPKPTRLCRTILFSLVGTAALLGIPRGAWAQDADELPLTGPAYQIASEAYEAFAQKDYQRAIAQAREAIRQRPDVIRLKHLLVESLLASGAVEEAERTASSFIEAGSQDPQLLRQRDQARALLAQQSAPANTAPSSPPQTVGTPDRKAAAEGQQGSDPAFQAADEAYKAYARKDYATAIELARKASSLKPESRDYRLLLINALAAGGRREEAEKMATMALSVYSRDAEILAQRGYIRMALRRYAAAADDFAAALGGGGTTKLDTRSLRLALADAALAAKQPQRALDALRSLKGERSYAVAARSGFALLALDRREEALAAFRIASAGTINRQERVTAIRSEIGILLDLDRRDEARRRFDETRDILASLPSLELAYLANRLGDDTLAAEYFQQAQAAGQLKGTGYADAAYVAKRLYDNERSAELFKSAIDEARHGRLQLPPQQLFGYRREVSELERTWGAYASILYGAVGVAPGIPSAPTPAGGNVLQAGTEIYWRPPGIGYRNGAIFEVFARAFETLSDETDGPTGASTVQGYLGARWKPFENINLVFEVSRLFPIGKSARTDGLLRVAYSNGYGTDLRVDVPDWWSWQVYGDFGYYVEAQQSVGTFEARAGRSFRLDSLSDRLVLTPFLAVGGGYDSSLSTPEALGAGAGLSLRYWFRETEYRAPMSSIDINIQYRAKLAGDDRAQGIFAGITVSY